MRCRLVLSFLAVFAGGPAYPCALAAQAPAPSLDEWMNLKTADVGVISPDGGFLLYSLQSSNWERNARQDQLWVVSRATGERRQLTNEPGSVRSAAWSPDGTRVGFLTSREGAAQVYLISAAGGTAMPLTNAENGVDGFRWSPDGKRIAFTSSALGKAAAPEPKEYHVAGNDAAWSAGLWVVDVGAGLPAAPATAIRLTDPTSFGVDDIAWSPDAKHIAVSGYEHASPDVFGSNDIYVVEVGSKAVRRLPAPGPDFFPVWSPDGQTLAFKTFLRSAADEYHTYNLGYVAVVPAAGGPVRLLSEGFDENATPIAWGPDGIYFTARHRTWQHLYRLDPGTSAVTRITEPLESVNFNFSFSADYKTFAFTAATPSRFQEIYVAPVEHAAGATSMTSTGGQLAAWKLPLPTVINWTSADGTPVEGVLFKPAGFDSTRRYPLVVIIHGGPLGVDQPVLSPADLYAPALYTARGALVLKPNYRGGIGYGAEFRKKLIRSLGIPQYEDILGGVDLLIQQGIVDSSRVGAMGWSHGGYLAAMISTYSDRFRAVSVGAGVSDWRLFYTLGAGNTVKPDYALELPWDDPEYYRSTAPLTYIKRARTPTLIQHGENDRTAPVAGAYELHRALLDQGVPVKLMLLRGAGHLPSGLAQMRAVIEQNLAWFDQWLFAKGGPGAFSTPLP